MPNPHQQSNAGELEDGGAAKESGSSGAASAFTVITSTVPPFLAVFAAVQVFFQPLVGPGVADFALTGALLLIAVAVIVIIRRHRGARRRIPGIRPMVLLVVPLMIGSAVAGAAVAGLRPWSRDSGIPIGVPTSAPVQPSPSNAPASASITATPDTSDPCVGSYRVHGTVGDVPGQSGESFWVVGELLPGQGLDHPLYFADAEVDSTFDAQIEANQASGDRRGKFVLVIADASATKQLTLNYEANQANDKSRYPDIDRVSLPRGSVEVAATPPSTQSC